MKKEEIIDFIQGYLTSKPHNQEATLKFNLEHPDSRIQLDRMLKVDKYIFCLWEMQQFLRRVSRLDEDAYLEYKSAEGKIIEIKPDYDTVDYINQCFGEILVESNIELDELNY